ncbi:hypothetical protein [Burkholderia glumae]|uniref:hypothetical protein n=1 Tax=Burkholderia glumae TaxID=337 RepID=UPI003BA2417B
MVCSSGMVCSWSVLLVAAADMADGYGGEQIPPGRRIEIAVTSETTLKGIHMGKSLDRPGDWATIEVSADQHLETLEKIHAMVDQLTSRGAFLNMAIYETTPHAGGPATFYFSPANSALAKALGAVASATGPIETRRVGIAVHENYAATLFAPSKGVDSGS